MIKQNVLVLVGTPHSGSRSINKLLELHNQISTIRDFNNSMQAKESLIRDTEHRYFLYGAHMYDDDVLLSNLAALSRDDKVVATLRSPFNTFLSFVKREKEIPTCAYLQMIDLLTTAGDSYLIIPMDKLAELTAEKRLRSLKPALEGYLNLELTEGMITNIIEWYPIGASDAKKTVTMEDINRINNEISQVGLWEKVRALGFDYK